MAPGATLSGTQNRKKVAFLNTDRYNVNELTFSTACSGR